MSKPQEAITTNLFLKSILKFSVSSWVNFFISILSVTIITRIFSPDIFGTLNIFNSASSLLMGIVSLGLDSSFLRFYHELPEGNDAKQLLAKCMVIPLAFFCVVSLIVVPLFFRGISNALFNKVSFIMIVLLCTNVFSLLVLNFFATCYRMRNDARNYTIQSILLQFFSKCFVIAAAFTEPTINTVLLFNTVGIFILTIVYFLIQKKDVLPEKVIWSFDGFGEVMKFAIFSWPIVIIIYLNTFLSQIVINTKLGTYQLGIYASTSFFISVLAVVQNGFKTYWAAFMYTNYKTEQIKIKRVHNYVLLFAVLTMGAFIISQNIIYTLLGVKYQSSRHFFTLVLIYPLCQIISETTAYGITIVKKMHYNLLIILLSTIMNIFGCYILVSYIGIIGAAIASTVSAFVYLILSSIIGQKYYQSISHPLKTIFAISMVGILAVSNCLLINNYWLEMLITVGIFSVTGVLFIKDINDVIVFFAKKIKNNVQSYKC